MASHAGTTTEELRAIVDDWLAVAKHAKTGRPFSLCFWLPDRDFKSRTTLASVKLLFSISGKGAKETAPVVTVPTR